MKKSNLVVHQCSHCGHLSVEPEGNAGELVLAFEDVFHHMVCGCRRVLGGGK